MFNERDTIKKIILKNPLAAFYLQQSGVDYLASLEVTLKQTCISLNKSSKQIIKKINFQQTDLYKQAPDIIQMSVIDLAAYLKTTHHEYIRIRLPFIESKIKYISSNYKFLSGLAPVFTDFKARFLSHIDYEENVFFPYLQKLQMHYETKAVSSFELFNSTAEYSVQNFIDNHSPVEEEIHKIQSLVESGLMFFVHDIHVPIINHEIRALIDDLEKHAEIEDNILVTKAKVLEDKLYRRMQKLALKN